MAEKLKWREGEYTGNWMAILTHGGNAWDVTDHGGSASMFIGDQYVGTASSPEDAKQRINLAQAALDGIDAQEKIIELILADQRELLEAMDTLGLFPAKGIDVAYERIVELIRRGCLSSEVKFGEGGNGD